ncbi:hypothetical protein [Fusibacter tunisiensis]|uniref:Transglutaminase-like domain-containing protein n=1 Tax=Fusibacter tunisiensis TaxID=1008308 RepID=A0ABS2MQ26_9FIRM|nr:hypothetical protein [Fusibacter tunisiensis]MBM7561517.1 hypothetical protein [Fusibacter tunisiensis]
MSLEKLVYSFREAIIAAKKNNESGELFRKFPVGQCGHTSDVLAQYLIDNGCNLVTYVNGTYYGDNIDSRQAHTWLLVDDWVIDITGDQFKYQEELLNYDVPVYIGPVTDFHRLFEINPGGKHEHFGLECDWSNYHELKTWYEIILQYLD